MSSEKENCRLKYPRISTLAQLKTLILDFNSLPPELKKEIEKQTREILAMGNRR